MTAKSNLSDLGAFLAEQLELEAATIARSPTHGGAPEGRALSLADDAEDFFRDIVRDRVEDTIWSVVATACAV